MGREDVTRAFQPFKSFLQNENWTNFVQDIVKNMEKIPCVGPGLSGP